VARRGLQKARRVGKIGLQRQIIPALPDIGAAFGRPSVFLGFSYPLRLAANRTALVRLSHQRASGRAPNVNCSAAAPGQGNSCDPFPPGVGDRRSGPISTTTSPVPIELSSGRHRLGDITSGSHPGATRRGRLVRSDRANRFRRRRLVGRLSWSGCFSLDHPEDRQIDHRGPALPHPPR
jgi:hypothetical protein